MTLKTINFRNRISVDSQQEREVKIMILLIAVFMSSVILGISLTAQNKELFISVYEKNLKEQNPFVEIFFNSLIVNLILLVIIFVSGFSSIGIPAVITVIIIKALSIGSYCTYFVSGYSLTGIGMFLLSIFPSNIIFMVLLLLASDYSIIQSIDILNLINDNNQNEKIRIRRFIYKNIIISVFMLFGALTEALFVSMFGSFIK